MSAGILSSFLGAVQACLSVLLTICYGFVAGQIHLLDESSARRISRLSIKILLPALLVTNLGSELHLDTAMRYLPILVWAIVYNILSQCIGAAATHIFKLPRWVTPAIAFNNTTSLPLLLVEALGSAGTLSELRRSPDDSISALSTRARSYFLVSSVVANTMTFGLGRSLLGVHEVDPAREVGESLRTGRQDPPPHARRDVEQGGDDEDGNSQQGRRSCPDADERTSLLPSAVLTSERETAGKGYTAVSRIWDKMPSPLKTAIARLRQFINPPATGALLGVVLGITPPLHRLFFADANKGGYFNAWLTNSIKNVGELFVALQVIIVGVKLAHSLRRMRRGESSGSIPLGAVMFTLFVRFILWPVVSIAVVTALGAKTNILPRDPVLWFSLMLMPTGPSAMKLEALAEVDQASDDDTMAISKFLAISYGISPLISLTVVGSLKAIDQWIR